MDDKHFGGMKPPAAWIPMTNPIEIAMIGKLGEEANELGKACARAIIQGLDGIDPDSGVVNRDAIRKEQADVVAGEIVCKPLLGEINRERVEMKVKHLQGWHELLREKLKPANYDVHCECELCVNYRETPLYGAGQGNVSNVSNVEAPTVIDALRLLNTNEQTLSVPWDEYKRLEAHRDRLNDLVIKIELERYAAQGKLDEAYNYAVNSILLPFVKEHCEVDGTFWAQPDLLGVLTQIDNATTVVRAIKRERDELQTRLDSVGERSAHLKKLWFAQHDIFKTGDANVPSAITDRNGEIVLACCKVCGKAEAGLDEPCDLEKVKSKSYKKGVELACEVVSSEADYKDEFGKPKAAKILRAVINNIKTLL